MAAIFLWAGEHRNPTKAEFESFLIVAPGIVFGFPFFTAWAMLLTSASHGGVVLVIALTFTLAPAILTAPASFVLPGPVWIGLIYASVVSQYIGF